MSTASSPKELKKAVKASLASRTSPFDLPFKKNTRKAANARDGRIAEWPDFEEIRAHVVERKQDIVDHLDQYQAELRTHWAANGFVVHDAADDVEARDIITSILVERGHKTIMKSKSMLSEEIEINNHLEQQGIEPIETDLGEFIVQLRGEKPSHITMPGMHLDRRDIGRLFHEKLGEPYTEDPPTLTQMARRYLRKRFLETDAGMIGVNFAVATTGHLATVTNEGNGRLVSTLPKTVIALMGYERMTQTLDDLAILWQVLARSGTGQRATSYFNLLQKPSLSGFGPREVHVVVVDNGRKRLAQDRKLNELLRCIRCGACLNACPVYQQVGGHPYGGTYPGPIGKALTPALWGVENAPYHPFASSLCGACKEICPVSIPIPELLLELRKRVVESRSLDPEKVVWSGFETMMKSYKLFEMAGAMGRTAQRIVPAKAMKIPGWTDHRTAPEFAKRPFRSQAEELLKSKGGDDESK